ncbi:MAG: alpha/beta hydrolase [Oscillospiraceae bacterium]|nr:alpha/beta hydrolase [Oscillospiraceae bacterium]
MKLALTIILISAAAFAVLCIAAGLALYFFGVRRRKETPVEEDTFGPYTERVRAGARWLDAQDTERLTLRSYDGLDLVGYFLPAEGAARGALLLMHGYRSTYKIDFSATADYLHGLGYDLLLVKQRACGESGGNNICYGVRERFDCRDWAKLLAAREPEGTPIFLYGLSLGCATVLMATGLDLPKSVRGVIADCGYTTPHEEFVYLIKRGKVRFLWPVYLCFRAWTRVLAGWGVKEASTLDAMAVNTRPVLFIHGGNDKFVAPVFSVQNCVACKAEKELVIIEGARHGTSCIEGEERYREKLSAFLERWGGDADRS